ncbi:MAG: type IV toxin-antitoxin system AbiEi family antitoxin domain-containing protein, partial [Actinomycetota bacterium]|nr:type IV toxin-antitoxin system AbiEi family antitoxin domain-containing protein [Actinomycetota bacterium]
MDPVRRRVAQIEGAQDNVITRHQLRQAGLSDRQIAGRIARGELTRLYRGVYLTGHAPPSLPARARAAVLACGGRAVVSHELAAALWGLGEPPRDAEVTVVAGNPGPKPGIRIHRVAALHPAEIRRRDGVPLTSPARTICDLAARAPRSEVEWALQEGIVRRLFSEADLEAVLRRTPNRPGTALMRSIMALEHGPGFTRSAAERALMR